MRFCRKEQTLASKRLTLQKLQEDYGEAHVMQALEVAEEHEAKDLIAYSAAILAQWRSEGRIGRDDYRNSDAFWVEEERKYAGKVIFGAKHECRIALCARCSRGAACGQEPERCPIFVAQRGRFVSWPACVSYDGHWYRSREGAIPV